MADDATPRTYPDGVPCWVDLQQPDLEAAQAFYGGLLGWRFTDAVPPGAPGSYLIATLDGADVAALTHGDAGWTTYVAVDDAEDGAARVRAAGGTVVSPPAPAGEGGVPAGCADATGVPFSLWQAKRRLGAQHVNAPGGWVFSQLRTDRPDEARAFYAKAFGWEEMPMGPASLWRKPGYGAHLAATSDPEIHERQAEAPPGFDDAVAWLTPLGPGEQPHWHVVLSVADRDEAAATVERLGGAVLSTEDSDWTRDVTVRDPQGAVLSLSQFTG